MPLVLWLQLGPLLCGTLGVVRRFILIGVLLRRLVMLYETV